MDSCRKIVASCNNCGRTLDVFDSRNEALIKIAKMNVCENCGKVFVVKSDYHHGFELTELKIDNSDDDSQSKQNEAKSKKNNIPFVSMSFDSADQDINNYIISILKSLQLDYRTGESYSKDSIPEKVIERITNSGLFIVIFVKRKKMEDGIYSTSPWLISETGIAQGCKKDIIALVEKGINEKEIANLNYKKELIYFDRTSVVDIQKATLKFLEALKEHSLI